ncbi:MAG: hypothetical protein AAFQ28_00175 [Pseudomonadota bacterium]
MKFGDTLIVFILFFRTNGRRIIWMNYLRVLRVCFYWTKRMAAFVACLMIAHLANAVPAQAQQFMSEAELLATIPGSQISGISNQDGKTEWVQAYSKYNGRTNGAISGLWDGKDKYKAKWFVRNGQWCEEWDSGKGCWQVERLSEKKLRIYLDGKPFKNTWSIR